MSLDIQIISGSSTPIYRQVVDQIRRAVRSGGLVGGDRLPTVRGLAELLVVNHNTIAKAYRQLVAEGILEAQPSRGYFAADRQRSVYSKPEKRRRRHQAVEVFISEVAALDLPQTEVVEAVRKELAGLASSNSS
ncbi:MAG: GntR family transcriptional regulator [Planctomycetota bacterium]